MFNFKKTLILLLCAAMLFCVTVPAFALTDSDVHSHIEYGIGVRVTCTSGVDNLGGSSKIVLSFVSNVDHLPQSDYYSRARVELHYYSGNSSLDDTGNHQSMTVTAYEDEMFNEITKTSYHEYWANHNSVYNHTCS